MLFCQVYPYFSIFYVVPLSLRYFSISDRLKRHALPTKVKLITLASLMRCRVRLLIWSISQTSALVRYSFPELSSSLIAVPYFLTYAAISLICPVSSLNAKLSIVMISIRILYLFAAKVRQRNLSGTVLTRYYREIFIEFVSECPSKATQATRLPCFNPYHKILIYLCAR